MKYSRSLVFASAVALALSCAAQAAGWDPSNITGTKGLILIDKRGNLVRFLDPATHKEISTLELGGTPHELAIAPDHRTAYIPLYGDGVYGRNPHPGHEIAVIDLEARKMTGKIDLSPSIAPHGLQVGANGLLYVTCDISRTFLILDPKTKAITSIDNEGTGHWIAVLPDGSKAYVANKQDRKFVSVIDLRSKKLVGRVPMPNGTQGITASPDGKRVVAAEFTTPTLRIIDTATDHVIDTVAVEKNTRGPFRVKYTPDGKMLATLDGAGTLNLFDAANLHAKQQVLAVGKDPYGIAVSADGGTALVSNHGDGTISVVDLKAGTVTSSFTAGTGIETLSYY
jgi:DNA-binding beta-propeller fold protein YncE